MRFLPKAFELFVGDAQQFTPICAIYVVADSLIRLPIVLDPTSHMPAAWIVMSPVNEAAFFVPDILATEPNAVANVECVDPWSDVDVVRDEDGLS